MPLLYGINNCDTVKKALKWLCYSQIEVQFFDFKKQPINAIILQNFIDLNGWENLVNKRSTSYRNLSDEIKNNFTPEVAFDCILAQPTLLKRPLLIHQNQLYLGFSAKQYEEIFKS